MGVVDKEILSAIKCWSIQQLPTVLGYERPHLDSETVH